MNVRMSIKVKSGGGCRFVIWASWLVGLDVRPCWRPDGKSRVLDDPLVAGRAKHILTDEPRVGGNKIR